MLRRRLPVPAVEYLEGFSSLYKQFCQCIPLICSLLIEFESV